MFPLCPHQYIHLTAVFRVQWFWLFFRNSICFMCVWFGLEILRLVLKSVFWNIERFLSYLTFYPPKKVAPPLQFCKKLFFWGEIFGNFLTQDFYTFLKSVQNSASFYTLCTQFWRISFKTLIRDGAVFLKLKAQIR